MNYCTLKIFEGGNVPCFPPTGSSHLQSLTQKYKILNMFKARPFNIGRTTQMMLFNWLSNLNVVLSIGSKNVQNVIQMALILKLQFFPKHCKRSNSSWGLSPLGPHSLLWLGTLTPNSHLRHVLFTLVCSPRLPIKTFWENVITVG